MACGCQSARPPPSQRRAHGPASGTVGCWMQLLPIKVRSAACYQKLSALDCHVHACGWRVALPSGATMSNQLSSTGRRRGLCARWRQKPRLRFPVFTACRPPSRRVAFRRCILPRWTGFLPRSAIKVQTHCTSPVQPLPALQHSRLEHADPTPHKPSV